MLFSENSKYLSASPLGPAWGFSTDTRVFHTDVLHTVVLGLLRQGLCSAPTPRPQGSSPT